MKTRAWTMAALMALGCTLPLTSEAGLYFGGAGSYAERSDYDDVDGAGGGKAILGYRFEPVPLMIEANYLDAGKAEVNGTDYELGFSGVTLTLGYFLPMSYTGSGIWLRGGFYNGDSTLDEFGSEIDKRSSSGAVFGIGGIWKLDDNFGIRLEYEGLSDVKDFADNSTLGVVSLGLVFEIPENLRYRERRERARRAPYPSPQPLERNDPPYQGSAPPPYRGGPEYRGEAPAYRGDGAGGGGDNGDRVASTTALKSQPRHGSATLTMLPAGAAVQPGQRESNIEGDWTFVLYGRYSGWIPDGSLAR